MGAHPWRYLNAGGYIGYAGAIAAALDEMIALAKTPNADDQELASLVYVYGQTDIALDQTGTFPTIVHFNGPAKGLQAVIEPLLG